MKKQIFVNLDTVQAKYVKTFLRVQRNLHFPNILSYQTFF